MSKDISGILCQVVSDLLEEKGYDRPEELNNGDCPTVAKRVASEVPDAEILTGITVFGDHRRQYPAHSWVTYDGKHYDAERTQGVSEWHELPIFRMAYRINPNHVRETYRTERLEQEWEAFGGDGLEARN